MLADTPPHLLVSLLDYFLQQLQSSCWAERTPYAISVKADQLSRGKNPLFLKVKCLRLGCGGMHQYIMHTEVHYVYGFADPKHRDSTLVDPAGHAGRNPPLIALKSDDVLAFSSWDDAGTAYQTCVGIVTKKQDKGRSGKKKKDNESQLERRLRHTTPKSVTVVLLPAHVVRSFFPSMDTDLSHKAGSGRREISSAHRKPASEGRVRNDGT